MVLVLLLLCALAGTTSYLGACTGVLSPVAPRDDRAVIAAMASVDATLAPDLEIAVTGYRVEGTYVEGGNLVPSYNVQFYDVTYTERSSGLQATQTVVVPYEHRPVDVLRPIRSVAAAPYLSVPDFKALCQAWAADGAREIPDVAMVGPTPTAGVPDAERVWILRDKAHYDVPKFREETYFRIREGHARRVGRGVNEADLVGAMQRYEYAHGEGDPEFPLEAWLASSDARTAAYKAARAIAESAGLDERQAEFIATFVVGRADARVKSVVKAGASAKVVTDTGTWLLDGTQNKQYDVYAWVVLPDGSRVSPRDVPSAP